MIKKENVLQIIDEQLERVSRDIFASADVEAVLLVVRNKINNMPEEDGWILCSEKYPEVPDEMYIVTNKYGEVDAATYDGLGYWDEYESQEIVAWMSRPEPYRPPKKTWKESMINKFIGRSNQ